MATRDRPNDVTTAPADVSNLVMNTVWFDHMRESRYSTANAVLCTQSIDGNAQCITMTFFKLLNVQDEVQLPSGDNEACERGIREGWSVGGRSSRGELAPKRDGRQQRRQKVIWSRWKQTTKIVVGFFG